MQCNAGGAKLRTHDSSAAEKLVASLPLAEKDAPFLDLGSDTDKLLSLTEETGKAAGDGQEAPPAKKVSFFESVRAFCLALTDRPSWTRYHDA